jgi:putative ABC transport system permease protein
MQTLLQDLRYGARMLLKKPGFTLIAVLTLALGVGANTAIFSVINSLMLRPLPYREPDRLVKVYQAEPDPAKGMLPSIWSYPRFEVLRDQSQSFTAVSAVAQLQNNLTGANEPERLKVEMVSASYFPMLGVEAVAGRAFTAEEDRTPGANLAAMLSFSLWQRRFGGDVQAIGKTIELDKYSFTIVGVAPPGFHGQNGTADAWTTMMAAPLLRSSRTLVIPNNYWFQVIARLKDGVSAAQAQSEMRTITEQINQKYPAPAQTLSGSAKIVTIAPLQSARLDPAIKKSFLILLVAVALVLLIACANIANLLLARAMARRKEFALRAALGASGLRLIRQSLTESVAVAMIGGALGAIFAPWALTLLKNFRPSDDAQFWSSYARTFDFFRIEMDWRALAFNFALALLTGVLFGLIPAIQSSLVNVNESLKEGAGGSATGFRSLRRAGARNLLVIGEIALSLTLLIGAGLMIRTLLRLQSVNLGFSPENVITMAAPSRNTKPELYDRLLSRVRSLPGVEGAAIGSTAPLLGHASITIMDIAGRAENAQSVVGIHSVSPEFFKTLRINLLKGRVFTEGDRIGAPRVALINRAAAERIFPGEEPLGKRVNPYVRPVYETDEKFVEVVGVVEDAKYERLEEAVEPDVYLCSLQPIDDAQTLIVRSSADPAAVVAATRRELLALDKNVPLVQTKTMTERMAEVTSRTRFITLLLGMFAGLALLLAAIGVYGVMAYSVSAREREMGVRIALGAQPVAVLRLVLRDGMTLTGAGLALGVLASWASLRVLKSQLYDVSATDPLTFIVISLLLAAVALAACWIPARRATKVDPMIALRCE